MRKLIDACQEDANAAALLDALHRGAKTVEQARRMSGLRGKWFDFALAHLFDLGFVRVSKDARTITLVRRVR